MEESTALVNVKQPPVAEQQQPFNHADHLIPHRWPPGVSGNPAGRKPGVISLTSKVKELLSDETRLDKIAQAMLSELESPNRKEYPSAVLKELWERLDGKTGPDIGALIDNRTINVIVQSEHARELTENINKRISEDA